MGFDLGMRLHVRMRTRLTSYATDSSQGSAVNSFFDQGKFEAIKTNTKLLLPHV